MSKAHLENIAFDFIRYANCWEDVEVLITAFDLNENSKVLSIASGGDNCFSLLAQNPQQVIAVDISVVQLYLVELKKTAITQFNRAEFLQFSGFTESANRVEDYRILRSELSADAKNYWDNHEAELAEGIIHVGKFERYFQLFKKDFLHTIHDQKMIDKLFEVKSADNQLNFYNESWFDVNWKQMHSTFFGEKMLGESGRDPEFMKQIEGSVPDLILEREVAHLKSTLCQSNPFLFYILNSRFDEAHLPHYVRKENYEAVKANLHKLVLEEGLAEEIAEKHSDITHFNLSNIFEYMDVQQFKTAAKKLIAQAISDSKFAYWNFMVHRNMADIYPEQILDLKEKSQELSHHDFGYFYKSFVLNKKQ